MRADLLYQNSQKLGNKFKSYGQKWRVKTNEELDKLIKHKNVINYIKAQRLSWFGHVQRMSDTRTVRKIFNWKLLTKRSQDPSTDGRITLNRTFAKCR